MPTLHLIDADSTQACPAVFAAIGAAMREGDPNDSLLIMGSRVLLDEAQSVGIERVEHLPAPFGRGLLGLPALRRRARGRPGIDHVHCWSIGALHAAFYEFNDRDRRVSVVHTPTPRQLRYLRDQSLRRANRPTIIADNPALANRLRSEGMTCETEPVACGYDQTEPMPADDRAALRASWGVGSDNERVVVLLSDHPRLTDAVVAAEVAVLGCATLTDDAGELRRVTLLLHPTQPERRRAADFIHHQPVELSVAQDPRVTRPWDVLGACDAALALGPDAGGLSLRYAAATGLPVIADADGPAGAPAAAFPNIRLARSAAIMDLAHQLHTALSG